MTSKLNKKEKKTVSQAIPLNVTNEGRVFAVTLAVSRNRLIQFLKTEGVSMGVLSMRKLSDEEKDALESESNEDRRDEDNWAVGGMG